METSERFLRLIHEIGSLVGGAARVEHALRDVVSRIATALQFDVVSIYLLDPSSGRLRLVASHGLKLRPGQQIELEVGQGLTSVVFASGRTRVFVPASEHPSYEYIPELGEEAFEAFLGTPIRIGDDVLGVLIAQAQEHRAIEPAEEKLFEVIADRLAAAVDVNRLLRQATDRGMAAAEILQGRGISRGLAVGPAFVVGIDDESLSPEPIDDAELALVRLREAFAAVESRLLQLSAEFEQMVGPTGFSASDLEILQTQIVLLNDSQFRGEIEHRVRGGAQPLAAIRDVAQEVFQRFSTLGDSYFAQRGDDILDIADRLRAELAGLATAEDPDEGSVLVAERLGPVQLAMFVRKRIAAVVTEEGGAASHAAILARSLGVPAVAGVPGMVARVRQGARLLVDGRSGFVFVEPSDELVAEYEVAEQHHREQARIEPLDGRARRRLRRYDLMANVSIPIDVDVARAAGLRSVGLFRTELAFLHRERPPTVMEQAHVYREIAEHFEGTVTIRTMDFGGDKVPSYLPFPEEDNPLLGLRSIRHSMQNLSLLRAQMRAVALVAARVDNIRVLLPMVTHRWEIETARDVLEQACRDAHVPAERIPSLGVMVETPALIWQVDCLADLVSFVSIGTNDFVQYLLAVDRYSETVGHLYSPYHPAVARSLHDIRRRCRKARLPVSVCGEMASDPFGALLLAALGFRALSIAPHETDRIRAVLGGQEPRRLEQLGQLILQAPREGDIRDLLAGAVAGTGVQLDLIDPVPSGG
ncbi:MAG: phosphoenolpyruvate--protein phosphotransferase [Candidatus Dadabacteria bacterium]|nr:MAG: phosphoenolpyruvate--protein phosphotransferase [Candidatus Dadabacteria bacterium]